MKNTDKGLLAMVAYSLLVLVMLTAGLTYGFTRGGSSDEVRKLEVQVEYLHALVEAQDDELDRHKKHIKALERRVLPECKPHQSPDRDECHNPPPWWVAGFEVEEGGKVWTLSKKDTSSPQ